MTDEPPSNEQNVMSKDDFRGFHSLVEKRDIDTLERFITDKCITPKMYDQYFQSHYVHRRSCAVGLAAKCGHLDVTKKMISLGFTVNEQSFKFFKDRPIHLACEAGNVAVVKSLVEDYGVDLFHSDNCSSIQPALCCAAIHGRLEVIQYFLENGTDINSKLGINGRSALHSAAKGGHSDICEYLISKGAYVDISDNFKVTPLNFAARYGRDVTARVLPDAGANINFVDDEERTPFLNAAENGHLNMMKLLASRGADPDKYNRPHYNSALHYAVMENRYDIAHYLVTELNVKLTNETDELVYESPLRKALREARFDMVDLLVGAGYNPVEEVAEFNEACGEEDDVDANAKPTPKRTWPYLSKDKRTELKRKLKELNCIIRNPRSLQALSVYTIRRLVSRQLLKNVDRLLVCEPLKKMLIFCNVTVRNSQDDSDAL